MENSERMRGTCELLELEFCSYFSSSSLSLELRASLLPLFTEMSISYVTLRRRAKMRGSKADEEVTHANLLGKSGY
jgi:hypothetical protein